MSRWKKEFLERASEVFKKGPSDSEKELEQKENRWDEENGWDGWMCENEL